MWTLLSLDLDLFSVANKSQSKIENRTANSVDPQETAPDDPSVLISIVCIGICSGFTLLKG